MSLLAHRGQHNRGQLALRCLSEGMQFRDLPILDVYLLPEEADFFAQLHDEREIDRDRILVGRLVWILPLIERGQPSPQWSTGVRPAPS